VENKPGTLYKVVHLVRLMRLNIEGLTLGVTNGGDTCRMTFTIDGDDAAVDHVAKQLRKVIDVLDAQTYSPEQVTTKELALVKVRATDQSKSIIGRSDGSKAVVVDSSPESMVVQVVGSAKEIDDFVRLLGTQVLDIARTGVAALPREERNAA
jgi:acetolactate synthase-1/3 small subunit